MVRVPDGAPTTGNWSRVSLACPRLSDGARKKWTGRDWGTPRFQAHPWVPWKRGWMHDSDSGNRLWFSVWWTPLRPTVMPNALRALKNNAAKVPFIEWTGDWWEDSRWRHGVAHASQEKPIGQMGRSRPKHCWDGFTLQLVMRYSPRSQTLPWSN